MPPLSPMPAKVPVFLTIQFVTELDMSALGAWRKIPLLLHQVTVVLLTFTNDVLWVKIPSCPELRISQLLILICEPPKKSKAFVFAPVNMILSNVTYDLLCPVTHTSSVLHRTV